MLLVIDDKIPFMRGQAERLGRAVYLPGAEIGPRDVAEADALIVRTRTKIDKRLLDGSRVRFVATATIGTDHIDTAYLDSRGIGWASAPGCNAGSVAQYVACALAGLWQEGVLTMPPEKCTVGVVGVGHVGKRVCEAVRRMGCRVLECDPPRAEAEGSAGFATLEEVLAEADVVTLHVPLTRAGRFATFHMADAAFFEALKKKPVFINAARGEVADTEALIAAIDAEKVGAAVIDTWEQEPHISPELLRRARIATPHIAGYSADGKACGTRMALEAVARALGRDDLRFDDILPPPLPEGFVYSPEDFNNVPVLEKANEILPHPWRELLRLYDPRRDSRALKACPDEFEKLRGDYPLRREVF